jgi:D-2-hydroxyacid dehydrogenase (NADP+)
MTRALILLNQPGEAASYRDRLCTQFPQITVDLADHFTKVDPVIGQTDVLITFPFLLRNEVLQKAPRLKWVQALGAGLDNLIDLPSLRPDVIVTNVRGIHGTPVSEAAMLSMLALARRYPRSIRAQQARTWDRWPSSLLRGKTVGIFGVGAIALDLALRCKAFGLRVVGISSQPQRRPAGFDEMRSRDDLACAVADLDFLVLLTPLTAATRHSVDARVFAAMKPTSYLVNVARGGVVNEADLMTALEQDRIAGAALDVFEQEPLPPDHPLWTTKNAVVTPHLAGFNDEYVDDALPIISHNMACFLAGRVAEMQYLVER